MEISVIIPTFQTKEVPFLEKTLIALSEQTLPPQEIIIIDSSEDDQVRLLVQRIIKNIPVTYKKVKKSYPGEKRNLGARVAKSKFLAFLDAKTIPNKNWLSLSSEAILKENLDIFFGQTVYQADTEFQRALRASTFGLMMHETTPGSLIKKENFFPNNKFIEGVRAGEDLEWRERLKSQSFKFSATPFSCLKYSGLPNRWAEVLSKYFIYSIHTAFVKVQRNIKDAYLSALLILSAIIIPKWNYLVGWQESYFFIPNVTKIYLLCLIILILLFLASRRLSSKNYGLDMFWSTLKILLLIFSIYSVYRWNALLAGWVESAILYIPHITKIFVGFLILFSLIYRGIYLPNKRKEELDYIFPFNWIRIGFIGLSLDIVKAPGYLLGSLFYPFLNLFRSKLR